MFQQSLEFFLSWTMSFWKRCCLNYICCFRFDRSLSWRSGLKRSPEEFWILEAKFPQSSFDFEIEFSNFPTVKVIFKKLFLEDSFADCMITFLGLIPTSRSCLDFSVIRIFKSPMNGIGWLRIYSLSASVLPRISYANITFSRMLCDFPGYSQSPKVPITESSTFCYLPHRRGQANVL